MPGAWPRSSARPARRRANSDRPPTCAATKRGGRTANPKANAGDRRDPVRQLPSWLSPAAPAGRQRCAIRRASLRPQRMLACHPTVRASSDAFGLWQPSHCPSSQSPSSLRACRPLRACHRRVSWHLSVSWAMPALRHSCALPWPCLSRRLSLQRPFLWPPSWREASSRREERWPATGEPRERALPRQRVSAQVQVSPRARFEPTRPWQSV